MPIDPSVAIGADLGSRTFSWTESDVLLYHLGIGAGSRAGDNLSAPALRYTLDDAALQVLPSFGVVAPTFHETDPPPLDLPGCEIDLAQVVHGAQSIILTGGAVPTSGSATLTTRITDIWDKGKAAVIWQEGTAVADSGEELWRVRSSIFVRGEGGWGGDRGAPSSIEETALAVQALAGDAAGSRDALQRGVDWLIEATAKGQNVPASPIGLYFAKLWYYEELYPLIFATGALIQARRVL